MRYLSFLPCLGGFLLTGALVTPARMHAAGPALYVTTSTGIIAYNSTGPAVTVATGLTSPAGIAFDATGNLYVGNDNGYEIDEISVAGVRSVVTTATDRSRGLAFGTSGMLYANDASGLERINPGGTLTLVSGGTNGFGLAVDTSGYFYTTNASGSTVTRIPPAGGAGATFASGLTSAAGLAFDSAGDLYVATTNTIMEYPAAGGAGTVFASKGLNQPVGLAFDSSGNLYAANFGDNTIERFDASGNATLFASGVDRPYFLAFGPAVVPEPSTWFVTIAGAVALVSLRARRRWVR